MAEQDSQVKAGVPPYGAAQTLWNFVDSLRQGIPTRIDKSMMKHLSGGVQSQLMGALRFLRLIDPEGVPTELLKNMVAAGDDRTEYVAEMVYGAYDFIRDGFDLKTATTGTLSREFENLGATGDTQRKCINFLIPVARAGGFEISPYIKGGGTSPSKSGNKKRKVKRSDPKVQHDQTPPPPRTPGGETPDLTKLLLEKFPDLDPSWDDATKSKWFDAFQELMERTKG